MYWEISCCRAEPQNITCPVCAPLPVSPVSSSSFPALGLLTHTSRWVPSQWLTGPSLQISTPCLPLCTSLLPGTLPCKFSRVLSSVFSNQWDQQMLWVFLPYLHAGYSHPTVNWSTFMASLIHVPLSGDHCSVLPVFQGPKPIFSRSCVVFYLFSAWG